MWQSHCGPTSLPSTGRGVAAGLQQLPTRGAWKTAETLLLWLFGEFMAFVWNCQ